MIRFKWIFNWFIRKKAYKATYNMRCRDTIYEVGKTYSIPDDPEVCWRGFHFCPCAQDTLNYYEYDYRFELLEVEILGKVVMDEDKGCTNKMKILRVIPKKEVEKLIKPEYEIGWF